ncbi:MAG: hypothetical protein ACFE0R_02090 [Salinarimonas sp.]
MTRSTLLLAALLIIVLGFGPRMGFAQDARDGDETGSLRPSPADAVDQPTAGEVRRLRQRLAEDDGAGDDLPPPEAISPQIDLLVPDPDAFQ